MPTMNETEKKQNWKYKLAMSVATFLVFLCVFVFDTDLKAFSGRAGFVANAFGFVFFAAAIFAVWSDEFFHSLSEKSGWTYGVGWAGGTLLGIVVSCGFNFDYFGL